MPWVPAAIAGGAALASAGAGAYASMKSANSAMAMTKKGAKLQKRMYEDYKKAMKPYAKGGYQAWEQLGKFDPTAGGNEFLGKLKDFSSNFQFNPNDPTYQFKLSQARKGIDQSLAARGIYNSRAGLNLLDESNRAITADEASRQYSRGYSRLMDLFNMSNRMSGLEYNKYLDLTKIGMGAVGQTANAGIATGQGVASSYADRAGIDLYKGAVQRDFWSGVGAMPLNFMILKNMFNQPTTGATGYPGPKPGY